MSSAADRGSVRPPHTHTHSCTPAPPPAVFIGFYSHCLVGLLVPPAEPPQAWFLICARGRLSVLLEAGSPRVTQKQVRVQVA